MAAQCPIFWSAAAKQLESPRGTADTVRPDWVDSCHEGPNGDMNSLLTIDLTAKKGGH
jgi:hypothetical protein